MSRRTATCQFTSQRIMFHNIASHPRFLNTMTLCDTMRCNVTSRNVVSRFGAINHVTGLCNDVCTRKHACPCDAWSKTYSMPHRTSVCVRIRTCVYLRIKMYMPAHVSMYMPTMLYACTCVHVYIYLDVYAHMQVLIYTYTRKHMYACLCGYAYRYIYLLIHSCIHMCVYMYL